VIFVVLVRDDDRMQRVLEPELMDDREQAEAYDRADFSESHGRRVGLFRERYSGPDLTGVVLDLGCGSGDVLVRFAESFPGASFVAVDGSPAMLALARKRVDRNPDLRSRVSFVDSVLPSSEIPDRDYSLIMSHSLLHHLHQPRVLWETLRQCGRAGTWVFVADLLRPSTPAAAWQVVDRLSANEPEVLRRDFYNSLCAAFVPAEVTTQLAAAALDYLHVEQVSDIHLVVSGRLV
jgi:ubiquinone/menaquinone biosynthesis C-methylase UbiE